MTRNTVVLVAKFFPLSLAALVLYRQLGWAWHAVRERRLRVHLRALSAAVPLLPHALAQRHRWRRRARASIADAVPARPIRGPRAGGHPAGVA